MLRISWVRSPQSIEVRFGTSRAGAVNVALYTTASVDAVIPARPEVDWEQLRAVEKGCSPLAALGKQAAPADRWAMISIMVRRLAQGCLAMRPGARPLRRIAAEQTPEP